MKKTIFLLFFSIIVCCKSYAQRGDTPPNGGPGKCYAKFMLPQTPGIETESPVQSQWEEIVCGDQYTPQLIQNLRSALIREGFKVKTFGDTIDSDLKIQQPMFHLMELILLLQDSS